MNCPTDPIDGNGDTIADRLDLAAVTYDNRAIANEAQATKLRTEADDLDTRARGDRRDAADCRDAAAFLRVNEAAK